MRIFVLSPRKHRTLSRGPQLPADPFMFLPVFHGRPAPDGHGHPLGRTQHPGAADRAALSGRRSRPLCAAYGHGQPPHAPPQAAIGPGSGPAPRRLQRRNGHRRADFPAGPHERAAATAWAFPGFRMYLISSSQLDSRLTKR